MNIFGGIEKESPLVYLLLFNFSFFSFILMYFSFSAFVFQLDRQKVSQGEYGLIVEDPKNLKDQINREIGHSLISIFIFGLYGPLTWYCYLQGWININFDFSIFIFIFEVFLLFIWNEIHFFCCHWLLHQGILYRRIHYIHHQSRRATPYSAYSFHWIEAIMLGSVMLCALFLKDFSIYALLTLPLFSLFFNVIGHSNLRAGRLFWPSASNRHAIHHTKINKSYGFTFWLFDRIFFKEKL